jgi:ankyrin repeat protein
VHIKDDNDWTPLHCAAHYGNRSAMQRHILINDHITSIGRTSCAYILFKNGAKLDSKDINQKTPLDLAVASQMADCVTFLR